MKAFGIDFAPLNVPLERRLQLAAVAYWSWAFVFKGTTGTFIVLYILLFTRFWILSILYLVWYWIDYKTCERGGRRSEWIRNWRLWDYARDYFPIRLIKTAELDPNKNYVCGYHPHGFFCVGAFIPFCTEALDVSAKFPNMRPTLLTLTGQFRFPLMREFILGAGARSVSRESINWLLSNEGTGNMVIIVIGGAKEMINVGSGPDVRLVLKNRRGFVRTALTHGASLLPIFAFGENDVYSHIANPEGSRLRRIQNWVLAKVGVPPLVLLGRGVFQYTYGFLPFRKPVDVFVGKPIDVEKIENPTEADVDHYHNLYVESLKKLFEENKIHCTNYKNATLTI